MTNAAPTAADSLALAAVHQCVSGALADLAELFAPGMRFTFVARHPDHPGRHMVITDDDLAGVAALLSGEALKGEKK